MPAQPTPPLFDRLAEHLREDAGGLTDRWLEKLAGRLGLRPRRLLPAEELRAHIPRVLEMAADHLALPAESLPGEATDILRSLAQLRRGQGYDIQEILVEFGLLSELVLGGPPSGWRSSRERRRVWR